MTQHKLLDERLKNCSSLVATKNAASPIAFEPFTWNVVDNPCNSLKNKTMTPAPAVLATLALLSCGAVRRVPDGEACTVYRWGRYRRTLESGMHLLWPLVDRIGHRISLTGRRAELEPVVITRSDGETVTAAGTVFFQVLDAMQAEEQLDHLESCIRDSVQAVLLEDELPMAGVSVAESNRALKRRVDLRLRRFGLTATRCQLDLGRRTEGSIAA